MTEEIIVDGVNVAGCNFYIQDYQRANNIEGRYEHCKDVCELNGDNYFYCKMNNDCYYKQLKRLEFELKITKADYEASEQENKVLRKTKSKLLADLHEANDVCNAWEKEVNKLRSALEEIREYCNSEHGSVYVIIDKINEVLND